MSPLPLIDASMYTQCHQGPLGLKALDAMYMYMYYENHQLGVQVATIIDLHDPLLVHVHAFKDYVASIYLQLGCRPVIKDHLTSH